MKPLKIRSAAGCGWRVACLTLAAVAIACVLTACDRTEKKVSPRTVVRPVKLFTVGSSVTPLERSIPGRVRAARRVDLAFQVGGPLVELQADEGQEVSQGQLLARIDPRDYRTSLRTAQGQLAKAQAALSAARSELQRIIRIRSEDPGAASESMQVSRQRDVDTAEAEVRSLEAAVEAARDQLSDTELRAPFDGVVSRRLVEAFQEVQAKEAILSLDDISRVEILVDIPEIDMARVEAEQGGRAHRLKAEFAAAPGRRFALTVKEYATRADPATQTYRVVLEMEQPEQLNVLPGMTATVTWSVRGERPRPDRFIVPTLAVFADESGQAQVWLVEATTMTVQKRQVETGELTGRDSIEVIEGLQSGDTVAVTGVSKLREGMKVRDLATLEGYGQ